MLRRALSDAVRYDMIARNVAAAVAAPPKRKADAKVVFTIEEVRRLVQAARRERNGLSVQVLLTLGVRRGELLGLRWTDVDLDDQSVDIRRNLKRRNHHGIVFDEPKTSAGIRRLPLTDELVDEFRTHRRRQAAERLAAGEAWQDGDYVFTTTVGTPIDPRNFERYWKAICDKADVPAHNLHTTRHTAGTVMLNVGVPLESITKILGHSSVATTADLYAKPSADTIRDAVARGAEAINPPAAS